MNGKFWFILLEIDVNILLVSMVHLLLQKLIFVSNNPSIQTFLSFCCKIIYGKENPLNRRFWEISRIKNFEG